MRRFMLSIAMALSALALAASSAWACTDPGISVGSSEVHPGDTVTYNVAPLAPGAELTVRVGEVTVDGPFKAEDGSVTRSFRMPDMGSVNRVSIEATIEHGDIENPDQTLKPSVPGGVAYSASRPSSEPTAPDSSSASDQSQPPADTAPPATGSAPADAAQQPGQPTFAPPAAVSGPDHLAQPNTSRGEGGSTGATRSSPGRRDRSVARTHRVPSVPAAARVVSTPAVATPIPADLSAPVVRGVAGHRLNAIAPVREPSRARPEGQVRWPVPGGSLQKQSARGTPVAATSRAQLSVVLPIGVAIALLIAAAVWMRRRGFGLVARGRPAPSTDPPPRAAPDLRELEIEAELQEIIAEENARRDRATAHAP